MNNNEIMEKLGDDPFGILKGVDISSLSFPTYDPPFENTTKPDDKCPECNHTLIIRDLAYECSVCHIILEEGDIQDLPVNYETTARKRLRVVGTEAKLYQTDLDRERPEGLSETQKKTTYQELLRYNRDLASTGGNPFPHNVLQSVAENYCIVQRINVKRSETKKYILAALVFHTCIQNGFMRSKEDVAKLLQLRKRCISLGTNYLRSVNEDQGLEIEINCNRLTPHLISTFAYLEIDDDPLIFKAIINIIGVAEKNHIGFKSTLRSKVVATTFEILKRKKVNIGIDIVASNCKIRKCTIKNFLEDLSKFHSYFKPIYRKYGINSSP